MAVIKSPYTEVVELPVDAKWEKDASVSSPPTIFNGKQARMAGLACALILVLHLVYGTPSRWNGWSHNYKEEHVYNHAAIATEIGICSQMGNDILLQQGNAVDAMVTSTLWYVHSSTEIPKGRFRK
jgi:hypothetical protein